METINDIAFMQSRGCEVAIDFTPKGAAYSYVAGVTTYHPFNTYWAGIGHTLTFTHTATFSDPEAFVTEVYWDFGDRTYAYGTTVQHSYLAANPHTQVTLRIKDNCGKYFYARKHLPLRDEPLVVLAPSIGVAVA